MRARTTSRSDAALLWFACLAAACAGYYIAFGLLGAAIDRQHERTDGIAGFAVADARLLAQRPALEHAVATADIQLRALAVDADKPSAVARFIRTAARIADERHVAIVQMDERADAVVPARRTLRPSAFESIPFDVELNGTYGHLLAMIRDLARGPLVIQIEIGSIESGMATGARGDAPLTAHLHVALQRLAQPLVPVSATRSL